MASSVYEVKELPDSPFQPTNISFPSRSFGVAKPVNRSFQASWFNRFHWLTMILHWIVLSVLFAVKLLNKKKS